MIGHIQEWNRAADLDFLLSFSYRPCPAGPPPSAEPGTATPVRRDGALLVHWADPIGPAWPAQE